MNLGGLNQSAFYCFALCRIASWMMQSAKKRPKIGNFALILNQITIDDLLYRRPTIIMLHKMHYGIKIFGGQFTNDKLIQLPIPIRENLAPALTFIKFQVYEKQ